MVETIIIENGTIITVDKNNKVYEKSSIVIQEDRIVDIGDSEKIHKKYKADIKIDAKNKAVLPGFINLHMDSGLIRGTAEDLPLWD
jgi:5-methylthioadenosine/S-adenosylhomocysteine deaminase